MPTPTWTYALSGEADINLADAAGDLIVGGGPDQFLRIPVGTNGQVLTVDLTQPGKVEWALPDVTQAELDAATTALTALGVRVDVVEADRPFTDHRLDTIKPNLWLEDPDHLATTFPAWGVVSGGNKRAAVEDGFPCIEKYVTVTSPQTGLWTNTGYYPLVEEGNYYRVRITGKFVAGRAYIANYDMRDASETVVETLTFNWKGRGDFEVIEHWLRANPTVTHYRLYMYDELGTAPSSFFIRRMEMTRQDELKFVGDFQHDNFSQWDARYDEDFTDRVTLVETPQPPVGRYAAQLKLVADDDIGDGTQRTELFGNTRFGEGEHVYIARAYQFPSDFPIVVAPAESGNLNIGQFLGMAADPDHSTLKVTKYVNPDHPSGPQDYENIHWGFGTSNDVLFSLRDLDDDPPNFQIPRDEWLNFIFHLYLSPDPEVGYIEVWYQGIKRELIGTYPSGTLDSTGTRLYYQTLRNSSTTLNISQGLYRGNHDYDTQTFYTAADRVANTLDGVRQFPLLRALEAQPITNRDIASDAAIQESKIARRSGTRAQRLATQAPAANTAGRRWRETDTGVLYEDDGATWFPITGGFVPKTADEVISNSGLQNDEHLKWPIGAGEWWTFDGFLLLMFSSATSDLKLRWTGLSAGWWGIQAASTAFTGATNAVAATGTPARMLTYDEAAPLGGLNFTPAAPTAVVFTGAFSADADGTAQLQFGMNTLAVENTTALKGSKLNLRRVS